RYVQDREELSDRILGKLAAAKYAGYRTQKDAERKKRDDERERDRAGHCEAGMLINPIQGIEPSLISLQREPALRSAKLRQFSWPRLPGSRRRCLLLRGGGAAQAT